MTLQRPECRPRLLFAGLLSGFLLFDFGSQAQQTPEPVSVKFELLNRQGTPVSSITDGDLVKMKVSLEQVAGLAMTVAFAVGSDVNLPTKPAGKTAAKLAPNPAATIGGRCIIPLGKKSCETDVPALGWYWAKGGKGETEREITAATSDPGIPKELQFKSSIKIRISPRPVVLVHGLGSNAATWMAYTKQDGFLASTGLRGFAVGDGQVEGTLSTGDASEPLKPTSTIAQNAEILGRYIAGVKRTANAQMVDLVAHSMGGLISRYYIDRVMAERDVAQLIMLGTPNGGSDCACLPASLGFYMPAVLELRPSYLTQVFNAQITRRQGVPFSLLAGTPIVEAFKAPCTDTPSDLVVSRASAAAVRAPVLEMPLLHTEMTSSEIVFKDFVASRLKKQAGEYPSDPDPQPTAAASSPVQFTKVFTGHVASGGGQEMTVNLDQVSVASFALFDRTRSLKVTVRGASGNVINPEPNAHGLIAVNDPTTMVTLGYGFQNPKPGPWKLTLNATAATPSGGADFALTAKVIGGATLEAQTNKLSVQEGQLVTIKASLAIAQNPMSEALMQAAVRGPDGKLVDINFVKAGNENRAMWTPREPGVYAIDIKATGTAPDGLEIERTKFLSVEVLPDPNRGILTLTLLAIGVLTVVTLIGFWLKQRWGQKIERAKLKL